MEKSWRDIFRIKEEEDATFDQVHSQHIQAYLNIHFDRREPYNKSDINTLYANDFTPDQYTERKS